MNNVQSLIDGFASALTLTNLGFGLLGTFLGTLVGVLPGIGPALAIALLLPITYTVSPASALIMFAAIYYGAMYGGSTTSILLNTPGESGSVITALEGNKMARRGRAGAALATGYAQVTGRAGVCIATSGPGATNLVTPLMDAAMDSVPLVAITGQVPSAAIGTDAFQEADIRGITMPFTKHNYLITDPAEIPGAIAEAFHIATTGRPGPVLVDVAKDALQKMTTFNWPTSINLAGYKPQTTPNSQAITDAAALIA